MTVRVSPGSPSKCSATLSPFPATTCLSTALYAALRVPSANQRATGAPDQSRVSVKGVFQVTCFRACSAQKAVGSAAAWS